MLEPVPHQQVFASIAHCSRHILPIRMTTLRILFKEKTSGSEGNPLMENSAYPSRLMPLCSKTQPTRTDRTPGSYEPDPNPPLGGYLPSIVR